MTPEQRAERIHYHEYISLEGIQEHSERIVALEELVIDMYKVIKRNNTWWDAMEVDSKNFAKRMEILDIKVGE